MGESGFYPWKGKNIGRVRRAASMENAADSRGGENRGAERGNGGGTGDGWRGTGNGTQGAKMDGCGRDGEKKYSDAEMCAMIRLFLCTPEQLRRIADVWDGNAPHYLEGTAACQWDLDGLGLKVGEDVIRAVRELSYKIELLDYVISEGANAAVAEAKRRGMKNSFIAVRMQYAAERMRGQGVEVRLHGRRMQFFSTFPNLDAGSGNGGGTGDGGGMV